MGHVFISYSKKDVLYAERLVNALQREGFNPWVDVNALKPGTYWDERLQEQIETCDAYILIVSPNAKKSKWVPKELVTAIKCDKPVFPLLLKKTKLFLAIETIQFEDVQDGKLPSEEFYLRLAMVTPRRKKPKQNLTEINLTDAARKKKVEQAAERASYFVAKVTSGVKDVIAVVSKVSSDTYKSVANSVAPKKESAKLPRKSKSVKKRKK